MAYDTQSVDPLAPATAGDGRPVLDKDTNSYRYAKALVESARAGSSDRIKTFEKNWRWLTGKDHFVSWPNRTQLDQWQFRGVVNWTWSTVKTKASILTAAQSEAVVEPLDDQSSYFDRLLIKSAYQHEAERTRFQEVKEKVYMSGSVTGVGISMWSARPDPLTGATVLARTHVPSDQFMRDPSVDNIRSPDCRFVVWDSLQDMSTIRDMFPSKAPLVQPEGGRQISGGWTYTTQGDANLIYGTAGDYAVDKTGFLNARKARVCFVWIKDESVIEDIQQVLISKGGEGYYCEVCDRNYPAANLKSTYCPECGQPMEATQIPDRYQPVTTRSLAYPYGRLIAYSGDILLYDGENPFELEEVFPFAVYHHDEIPGDFYGGNDVELLQPLQDAQNRSICQLTDYVRLAANAPILYPVVYNTISELGNAPNQRLPGPNQLPWQPFRLSTAGFDTQSWGALNNALFQHFQIVSGLAPQAMGQTSSPPISATEAEISNARLSDRMRAHATALSQWATDDANIQYKLMRQFYDKPMRVAVRMPDSQIKSIEIECAQLPAASVRISINPEETMKDKLLGQNAIQFAQSGMLDSPYADLFLGKLGFSPSEIKEFQTRKATHDEMTAQFPAGGPPGQGPGPPLSLVPGGQGSPGAPQIPGGPSAELQPQ